MAPPSGLNQSALPSDFETPLPPLVRSSTVPALKSHRADPSPLAPEDAYAPFSSPPRRPGIGPYDPGGSGNVSGTDSRARRLMRKETPSRSRSRRRKRFQKLLWVKQSCAHASPYGSACVI